MMNAGYLEIPRKHLLERLNKSRPRIIAVIAPAGFGKTTLARQFVGSRERYAFCDCAGLEDALDLCRRMVPALADEAPERGAALSQTELLLADGATEPADRIALALGAWRASSCESTFVFENAETLASLPATRELFMRLLASAPEPRTVLICARDSLRLQFSRFVPPHLIVTVHAADLAFTRAEVEHVLRSSGACSSLFDRAFALTQGWPIGVLLLWKLSAEGRLDELLDRLGDVAFNELHAYLANEILVDLDDELQAALFAIACIPGATPSDIAAALGARDVTERLVDFEKTSPFITRARDGSYAAHPLINSLVLEDQHDRRDALLALVAAAYEAKSQYVRSAELHLARPNHAEAARVLERGSVAQDHGPSMRYRRVLASLDRQFVAQWPTLWGVSVLSQMYCVDPSHVLTESGIILRSLAPDTPTEKRKFVVAMRALAMAQLGMFAEALSTIESVVPRCADEASITDRTHGYALMLRGALTASLGDLDRAERDLEVAWPLINDMSAMASGALMLEGADIARARGERSRERVLLEQAVATIRTSQLSNLLAIRLCEAAFGAWLAGEDELFERNAAEVATIVRERGVCGISFFGRCMRAISKPGPDDLDSLRWVVCAHLIASGNALDAADGRRHALEALEAARRYSAPFLQTLAALACAVYAEGAAARKAYEEALDVAAQVCSEPLHLAVRAASSGSSECGFLSPFVQRLRARCLPRASLEIGLLTGKICGSGTSLELPDRERAILWALSSTPGVVSRAALTEMLWPDLSDSSARNALHVSMHRLRQHLRDERAIVRTRDGYRLGDTVRVDLWEIERVVQLARGQRLTEERVPALRAALDALCRERPAKLRQWAWFEPVERHLVELRCEAAQRLGEHALDAGRSGEALALAADVLGHDSCDESANEMIVRAHLAAGDRAAAISHFSRYRDELRGRFDCEPPAQLKNLMAFGSASGESPTEPVKERAGRA